MSVLEQTSLSESGLRDFLDQYANASGEIQGDPATIAAEAAAAGLVERETEPAIEEDAVLMIRGEIVVMHDNYMSSNPPLRWIIEEIIAVGSVPTVTGCEHKTVIEYDIPVKSVWVAFEQAHDLDVALGGYGVELKITEDNIVTDTWRNTSNEAMHIMYARDSRNPDIRRW